MVSASDSVCFNRDVMNNDGESTEKLYSKEFDEETQTLKISKKQNLNELTGKAKLNMSTDFFLKRTVDYVEDQKIGKFKLIKTLGKGSSAKVVKAVDTETNKVVAIKVVERSPKNIADTRIFREVLVSSLLNHPHIVKLLDFFYNDKFFFMVFEHVEGKQLYDVVLNQGALDEETSRKYFRQIVSAVDYIHRNSIVHRDLKIENILVDEFDNIKLIDFGLSNFYDTEELLGTFCGSLYFAAPELLMGNRYVGPEVDVWSLGVILYVLLIGRVPFDDESIHQLQNKIKKCKFVFHNKVSAEAHELLLSMILASDARISLENVKKSQWLNLGYDNLVNNFMVVRKPITGVNENIVNVLSAVGMFQFSSIKDELVKYAKISQREGGSLEKVYWDRKPIVSLYYLTLERFEELRYISTKIEVEKSELKMFYVSNTTQPMIMHNFIKYLTAKEQHNIHNTFFNSCIFKHKSINNLSEDASDIEETTAHNNKSDFPEVRKSFVKGLFKGLKVKNITQEMLKEKILKVFLENNVIYEVNEKSYFCTFSHKGRECFFKITLYFNVILSEHYIVMNCLNKNSDAFKVVYEIIKQRVAEM